MVSLAPTSYPWDTGWTQAGALAHILTLRFPRRRAALARSEMQRLMQAPAPTQQRRRYFVWPESHARRGGPHCNNTGTHASSSLPPRRLTSPLGTDSGLRRPLPGKRGPPSRAGPVQTR